MSLRYSLTLLLLCTPVVLADTFDCGNGKTANLDNVNPITGMYDYIRTPTTATHHVSLLPKLSRSEKIMASKSYAASNSVSIPTIIKRVSCLQAVTHFSSTKGTGKHNPISTNVQTRPLFFDTGRAFSFLLFEKLRATFTFTLPLPLVSPNSC